MGLLFAIVRTALCSIYIVSTMKFPYFGHVVKIGGVQIPA
jgi:hypothetical protein